MISKIKWLFKFEKELKKMMADKQEKIDALKAFINAPSRAALKQNMPITHGITINQIEKSCRA